MEKSVDARSKLHAIARGVVRWSDRSALRRRDDIQAGESGELGQDVGGVQNRPRAISQKRVRSRVGLLQRMSRHGENLAPSSERQPGGNQRARALRGFDDHDDAGEPRDDPIAARKRPASDRDPVRMLARDTAPFAHDPRRETTVRGRDRDVEAAGENGDRRATDLERASMRGRVDADRASADDHDPGRRESGPQPLAHLQAESRRPAGTDNRAPEVPDTLAVEPGTKVHFHGSAVGVQIYTWNGTTWGAPVPEATLFHGNGIVTIHFEGPRWQSNSGSIVLGAVAKPPVTVDPDAIPWVLLKAVSTEGPGIFADTTFIQRVHTAGGKAPSVDGTFVGQVARVPYTADYFFYRHQTNH